MRLVITASRALRAWRETTACLSHPPPAAGHISISISLFCPFLSLSLQWSPGKKSLPFSQGHKLPSHTHTHTQRHALNINISSALDSSEIYSAAKPAENWLVSWRQAIDTLPLGELGRQREGWMERQRERVCVCTCEKKKERESERMKRAPPLQDNVISSVGNGDE